MAARFIHGIWDIDDKESFSDPFKGHTEAITKVNYSQDGIRIVSKSINGTVIIRRAVNWSIVTDSSKGHMDEV